MFTTVFLSIILKTWLPTISKKLNVQQRGLWVNYTAFKTIKEKKLIKSWHVK